MKYLPLGNTYIDLLDGIERKSSILNNLTDNDLEKHETRLVLDAAGNINQYDINILAEVGFNPGKGIALPIQLLQTSSL